MKLEILKFDHFGRGIGRSRDKVIFVEKALPKEIVDAKVTLDKKTYSEAQIIDIIQSSQKRLEPVCPFYNKCGGCDFLHTSYQNEKEFKKNKALELLGRCDNFYETKKMNYRNKVTLHVEKDKIGLYEEKSKKIVSINYCYLLSEMINKVISDLSKIDFSKYDITRIIIKENRKKLLVDIDGEIDKNFLKIIDYVDTIICKKKVIKGDGCLEEKIGNKIFRITSNAFFQVNKEGLEAINMVIERFLKDKRINHALDLYSGTSLWGILISDYVKKVTSVEINKESCNNALINIQRNEIDNIKVINGKVEDYIDTFKSIDLVIIDPPRSGIDKKTREYLKIINSKYIIYISCDMFTLKRDLEDLKEIYEIKDISLVDMFKRTYHVETVCLLCRKTIDK